MMEAFLIKSQVFSAIPARKNVAHNDALIPDKARINTFFD
jgi:hypothetical protein